MQMFSIICLTILLLALQHILNWAIRAAYKEGSEPAVLGAVMVFVIITVITVGSLPYLATWIVTYSK